MITQRDDFCRLRLCIGCKAASGRLQKTRGDVEQARKREAVRPRQPDGPPLLDINPQRFERQLRIAALSVLLLVLFIYLLREFAAIFQPLLIAAFLLYLIQPAHRWLVAHRVPSKAAHIVILAIILGTLFGVGQMVYDSAEQLRENWHDGYEEKLDAVLLNLQKALPFSSPHAEGKRLRDLLQFSSVDQV